ncbi:DUF421 domain-containing protein [Litorimonas cladophorae]|uniref:DUF421 domain-containing protein n=1 Tax=Litorimonas cladophorae TaxID=1220491 RepID=A0A918KJG4_9PROT|nr:YetF domain-containing protein [Litorimonas cladophorae]GGX65491.1 DUF421 domain-containing protein [Litorimonas cladophorae]
MLKDWLAVDLEKIPVIFLTVVLAYAGLVVLTRLSGVRSFSKMSGFDFAVTVSIGSIFGGIIMSENPSVAQGLLALSFVFAVQMLMATVRQRWDFFETLVSNSPRVIMVGSEIQQDQMRAARISEDDLYAKLREANVFHTDQIIAVIAETTGDVSVLHTGNQKHISPEIFENITASERIVRKYPKPAKP